MATFANGDNLTAIFGGGVYRPVPGAAHNWPSWYHGDAFYGEYYSGFYRRMKQSGGSWEPAAPVAGQPNATDWGTGLKYAVDFLVGPDGSMWWLRQFDDFFTPSSGSLQRIRFDSPLADAPPAPGRPAALLGWPNPFAGGVEIAFRLEAPGPIDLAVYDVTGRRIRTLMDGVSATRETRIAWNGVDQEGRSVPPGVYLARLAHGGEVRTLRLLCLDSR
jgi:hypothetical protein